MVLEALQTIRFPKRIGGHIALDFTNTAEHRGTGQFRDSLLMYNHWLAWCWRYDLLSDVETDAQYRTAIQHPQLAEQAFLRAITLREGIYEILSAVSIGQDWRTIDLFTLNDVLREGYRHHQLASGDAGFSWIWVSAVDDFARPLWAIAHAAAELLTSEQLSKVRQCPNCGWWFIDTSRNGMRRWCSMDYCGSQVKSRRQYERKRAINK